MRDVPRPQAGPDSAQAAVQQPPKTVPVVQGGKISNWPGFEAVLHSLLYDKVGTGLQTGSLHRSHTSHHAARWDTAQVLYLANGGRRTRASGRLPDALCAGQQILKSSWPLLAGQALTLAASAGQASHAVLYEGLERPSRSC